MKKFDLSEFEFIEEIAKKNTPPEKSAIIMGIGDDACVFKSSSGNLMLATVDCMVEDIHFKLPLISAGQLGIKSAVQNLSDIAAMGGTPTLALASVGIPEKISPDFAQTVISNLSLELAKFNVVLAGGNTTRTSGQFFIQVTIIGEVEEKYLLKRKGASVGDLILVTGELGGSIAGLELITDKIDLPEKEKNTLTTKQSSLVLKKHLEPDARVPEGQYLARTGCVTACIDVSDGLAGDAAHLALASDVKVVLFEDKIPVHPQARQIYELLGMDPVKKAYQSGEEYELLFCAKKDSTETVINGLYRETGTRSHIIGEIRKGSPCVFLKTGQKEKELINSGFTHF